MTIIFNQSNLLQGINYQSLNSDSKGYLRASFPLIGANIQVFIRLAIGGQTTLLGTLNNTTNTLPIPEQFNGSKIRLQFISSLDLPSLKVEFLEQYNYSFSKLSSEDNFTTINTKLDSITNLLSQIESRLP